MVYPQIHCLLLLDLPASIFKVALVMPIGEDHQLPFHQRVQQMVSRQSADLPGIKLGPCSLHLLIPYFPPDYYSDLIYHLRLHPVPPFVERRISLQHDFRPNYFALVIR